MELTNIPSGYSTMSLSETDMTKNHHKDLPCNTGNMSNVIEHNPETLKSKKFSNDDKSINILYTEINKVVEEATENESKFNFYEELSCGLKTYSEFSRASKLLKSIAIILNDKLSIKTTNEKILILSDLSVNIKSKLAVIDVFFDNIIEAEKQLLEIEKIIGKENSENLWQLFIDKDKQAKGPYIFENEPGYLRKCYKAFAYALNHYFENKAVDYEFVRVTGSLLGVAESGSQFSTSEYYGEKISTCFFTFTFSKSTISSKILLNPGLSEILQQSCVSVDQWTYEQHKTLIEQLKPAHILIPNEESELNKDRNCLNKAKYILTITNVEYNNLSNENSISCYLRPIGNKKFISKQLINQYNMNEIKSERAQGCIHTDTDQAAILETKKNVLKILELVKELMRTHPLLDGNGRALSMILFYRLLMNHGIMLSSLPEDLYSMDSIDTVESFYEKLSFNTIDYRQINKKNTSVIIRYTQTTLDEKFLQLLNNDLFDQYLLTNILEDTSYTENKFFLFIHAAILTEKVEVLKALIENYPSPICRYSWILFAMKNNSCQSVKYLMNESVVDEFNGNHATKKLKDDPIFKLFLNIIYLPKDKLQDMLNLLTGLKVNLNRELAEIAPQNLSFLLKIAGADDVNIC